MRLSARFHAIILLIVLTILPLTLPVFAETTGIEYPAVVYVDNQYKFLFIPFSRICSAINIPNGFSNDGSYFVQIGSASLYVYLPSSMYPSNIPINQCIGGICQARYINIANNPQIDQIFFIPVIVVKDDIFMPSPALVSLFNVPVSINQNETVVTYGNPGINKYAMVNVYYYNNTSRSAIPDSLNPLSMKGILNSINDEYNKRWFKNWLNTGPPSWGYGNY